MKKLTILIRDEDMIKLDLTHIYTLAMKVDCETVTEKKKRTHFRPINGMDTRRCIMEHYSPSAFFDCEAADKWMTSIGYSASSSSPALSELASLGFIKKVGHGKYQFMKPMPTTNKFMKGESHIRSA